MRAESDDNIKWFYDNNIFIAMITCAAVSLAATSLCNYLHYRRNKETIDCGSWVNIVQLVIIISSFITSIIGITFAVLGIN